jgi:hypothetical protein
METKILSRKLILSAILAIVATIFMGMKLIAPVQWQWVVMATVVSYVAGVTIQRGAASEASARLKVPWKMRLKALFSDEFAITLATVLVTSAFLFYGVIPKDIWFTIITALGACYNILNPIAKLGEIRKQFDNK